MELRTFEIFALVNALKNARKDLIREKEQHIEQLLKEREMERCEVTRAAAQADEAEHQLALLQRRYQEEREATLKEQERLENLLTAAEASRSTLAAQVDDLQFRLEETEILYSEMEVASFSFRFHSFTHLSFICNF